MTPYHNKETQKHKNTKTHTLAGVRDVFFVREFKEFREVRDWAYRTAQLSP